jgi:hypothetical protein
MVTGTLLRCDRHVPNAKKVEMLRSLILRGTFGYARESLVDVTLSSAAKTRGLDLAVARFERARVRRHRRFSRKQGSPFVMFGGRSLQRMVGPDRVS